MPKRRRIAACVIAGLCLGSAGLAKLQSLPIAFVLLAMVLLSIVSRQIGFNVPGVDAYAGYMMAGAGFLALAHTLKRGEHIRVTLLLSALHGGARRAFEIFENAPGVLITSNSGAQITDFSQLRVGDLVFFDADVEDGPQIDHVGIYLGNGLIIDAPTTGQVVHIGQLQPYWTTNLAGIRRVA